ncbi:MAG: L,D-transpeptidase [Rhizobiaceae bacterium]|nr:L,D-transpeptidase [Rhizobiaceae bacterium]MBL4695141.1 L,D-transpeptidase [Rhizobiaceae bacterium]
MRSVLVAVLFLFTLFTIPAFSAAIEARIDISKQQMKVYQYGRLKHVWKVSTGKSGYGTPTGSWRPTRMHRKYYSKKYHGAAMPHAIFFRGGYAIHGTSSIKRLGRTASHGCVRLHPSNAQTLFNMVKRVGPSNAKVRIVR